VFYFTYIISLVRNGGIVASEKTEFPMNSYETESKVLRIKFSVS